MTDQDVAFAIAQWCSGITQKEISKHFGFKNSSPVCTGITYFCLKYAPHIELNSVGRKYLAKIAFCHFMAQREAA